MISPDNILELGQPITLRHPAPGEVITVSGTEGGVFRLGFNPASERIGIVDGDLVFIFPNHGKVVIQGFSSEYVSEESVFELPDGTILSLEEFLEAYDIEVYNFGQRGGFNAVPESGLVAYSDDSGELIDGVDRLGKLGTIYWGNTTKLPEIYQGLEFFEDGGGDHSITLPGSLSAFLFMYEDGRPFKNMLAPGADPATGPADGTFEMGYDPVTGMPITFTLNGISETPLPADPDAVYVHSITIGALPGAEQGVIFYNGQPVSQGQVIANPDLGAFSFKPTGYYSGDVDFNFSYVLASGKTGPATDAVNATGKIRVDSVADLPDANSEATGETAQGDNLVLEAPVFEDGWAEQSVAGGQSMAVTFDVTGHFYDLDGSEIGWIDVQLPQGFSIPPGSDYTLVRDATGNYARIPIGDLTTSRSPDGTITVPVTLIMDTSATDADKSLTIRVVAHEKDTLDTDGHSTGNNNAERVIVQDTPVDILPGSVEVKVGWAYEGNKYGGTATGDITTLDLDALSTGSAGAPISFVMTNGTLTGATVTVDPALGTLYFGGTALVPGAGGVYTLTPAQLASNALTFVPSGYSDGDVPLKYVLTGTDTNGNTFTFTGETKVVVDAVADAGEIKAPITAMVDTDNATFDITVNAEFKDIDGSERHYILVEYNEGWTSPDAYDLIVVYYDSDGNPLSPAAYDPDNGEYLIDISGYAYYIPYFRFDVTDQSVQAGGNATDYTVRVVPPQNATDIYLKAGTMSEEYPADLNGSEYDVANNIAVSTGEVLVNVVDSTAFIAAVGAYENHNPDQYTGDTTPVATDGIITINLQGDDSLIRDPAKDDAIVVTFTYDPDDPAANPTPGSFYSYQTNLTYVFGITTDTYSFTQIPGTNQYQLIVYGRNIPTGSETFRLRYNPPPDDDTDITGITATLPVVSGGGQEGHVTTNAVDMIVDAVANKPVNVTATPDYGTHSAAQSGSTVEVALHAEFGDWKDGSEEHYIVIDLNSGFNSIDPASLPTGVTQLTPAEIQAAGLNAYADGGRYLVYHVPNSYLQANNGTFTATVDAGIDTVTKDSTLKLGYIAVSVDKSSDGGEITSNNNYASTPAESTVVVHTVTSIPVLHATTAFENDTPNANFENYPPTADAGGAHISLTGMDPSEKIQTLTITWDGTQGELYYNGTLITDGMTVNNVHFTYASGSLTMTQTTPSGVDAAVGRLTFVPNDTFSDRDVSLTYSGTVVDTASGMTKNFGAGQDIPTNPVPVVVDAVAQKPADGAGEVGYHNGVWSAAHDSVDVSATARFFDTADGSERHYLLIEVKSYFETGTIVGTNGISLETVGYNGTTPLSPDGNGGWLNPNPSTPGDHGAVATNTRTFLKIPVDDLIEANRGIAEETPKTVGDFTITRHADGTFTITYANTIAMDTREMTRDFTDSLAAGGMSVETATKTGGDGSGGKESYQYNNTAYDLVETPLEVAVVGTTNVSVITGWGFENNSPDANNGNYHTGDGAGILAIRTDPGVAGQDYANEQITLTFTYNSLYKDADTGEWVIPGTITYDYPGATAVTTIVNPDTGLVTATVIIHTDDTQSVVSSTAANPDPDSSHIRFIPDMLPDGTYQNSFNEADINLGYTALAEDMASGAVASVGGGGLTIPIDAVADKPVISDLKWEYNGEDAGAGHTAFKDGNVTLRFTANFPDNAPDGTVSEGQYILVRQNERMDLDPAFKLAVAQAGFSIDNYVVAGDTAPYYRIPAAYFAQAAGSPAGSHNYDVMLPMVMKGGVSEGSVSAGDINADLKIYAVSIVEDIHGREEETSNNAADDTSPLPGLEFAVVNTTVNPGEGKAYEQNEPNANTGDDDPPSDAPGSEIRFSLGLNVGSSPETGTEQVSDVTINYDGTHGTLYYYGATGWVAVAAENGTIPSAYAGADLKYEPKRLAGGLGDQDQEIRYSLTATEPASGAEKTFTGNIPVVVDAVAEKPGTPTNTAPVYGEGDASVTYGETVTFTVETRYVDHDKSENGHSQYYILVQQPSSDWTISYPGMDARPYEIYIYNGESYFRIPVDPSQFDASGNVSMDMTLTAPPAGSLLYTNSAPIKVYALSVARDPNQSSMLPGDQELTYGNNWAYSEADSIDLVYDTSNQTPFVVDPLYENNKPQGNVLGPDKQPDNTSGGGTIHITDTFENNPVDHVRLTWDTSQGELIVNGVVVTPTLIGSGPQGYYDIRPSDNAAFQSTIPNSDRDMSQVTADFYGSPGESNHLGTATYTPTVDAVAQVPTDLTSHTEYGEDGDGNPHTAGKPGDPVDIVVNTTFHDLEPHSDRFVLVEAKPGWSLPPGVSYPVITGSDGKQYWQVPVDNSDINPSTGEASVRVPVIPPASGGAPGPNGTSSYDVSTGAMTVRHPTGGSDNEVRDDNNVSYNVTDSTEVVISRAESNPVLNVTPTYAGSDDSGSGTPNPNAASNIYVTGLNQGSDTVSQVVLTYNNTNGDVTYNGTPLTSLTDGVTYTNNNGVITATITNPDIIAALTAGSAGDSAVRYEPKTYNDSDVGISASFTVNDNFSSDSKTTGNTTTIIVDAVAVEAKDVTIDIPGYTGAVVPGASVPVSVSATFVDLENPNPNGHHYLAIEQHTGWIIEGGLPTGVSVQTYEGVTYYVIDVDQYGNSNLPYLINNGGNNYTFTLPLKAPDSARDVEDAASIRGGAVVVQNPRDEEVTFDNNTNVMAKEIPINIGVVETTNVPFSISPVVEDAASGATITISPTMLGILNDNNEKVTSTDFTFTGNFSGYPAGTQVGSIIYNGKVIPVLSNGNGTASAAIDFGADGYKSSDTISLVWGNVATDAGGNAIYDSPGVPRVTDWNHTGSDMTVASSSTLVDIASGDTKAGIPGSTPVTFVPTADAPTDITAANPAQPVGSGSPVTFTVSGQFADTDGSEQHYYLVEQLPGWTGNYQTVTVDGTTFFMVPISNSTAANPSVNVTLNTPAGITADGSYILTVGGMSVDGASTATSGTTTTTTVVVGVVNATGVTLTMGQTTENDGSGPGTPMQFAFDGTPDNDSIKSITITDLQGGKIIDASGNVLFASAPATLDMAVANANGYYYLPPQYGSGEYTLSFTAVGVDNASGATTTFAGQTGSVIVTPVSTPPVDPSGTAGTPVTEPGHQAEVPITIRADFPDASGTEDHFFLVRLPAGVTPPAGFTLETDTDLINAANAAGMTGDIYRVNAASNGSASFSLTVPSNASGDVAFLPVAAEPGESPAFSSGAGSVTLPNIGVINIAPDADTYTTNTPVDTNATGAVSLTDPDPGDTVTIASVTFNGQTVTESGGAFTIQGDHGLFTLQADGNYIYVPNPGATGTDVFSIVVQDTYGGTSTSTVTVNVGVTRALPLAAEPGEEAFPVEDQLLAAAFEERQDQENLLLPENNDWAQALHNEPQDWVDAAEGPVIPFPDALRENTAGADSVLPNPDADLPDLGLFEPITPSPSWTGEQTGFDRITGDAGSEIYPDQAFIDDMMLAETIKMLAAG